MRILVIGAGVLGSLFAARLHDAGEGVTLLARGERLEQLRKDGVVLVNAKSGERQVRDVPVTATIDSGTSYDLALVVVRYSQVESVLDLLRDAPGIPNVLFLGNNPDGADRLKAALGEDRVLMGFAGAAGKRVDGEVHYTYGGSEAPWLIFGEPHGRTTPRTTAIKVTFEAAGFQVEVQPNMDAWLKYHAALVIPLGLGIYASAGDNQRMARTPDVLLLTVRAIHEGIRALRSAGHPVTPDRLEMLLGVPEPLLVLALRLLIASEMGKLAVAEHANAARDEMTGVLESLRALIDKADTPTPSLDTLMKYRDPQAEPIPEGQRNLKVDMSGLYALTGVVLLFVLALILLGRRRERT